jgi:type III secretion system low calcium response chaperone LcrH/SycD
MTTQTTQPRASLKNSAIEMEETFSALLTGGVPLYLSKGWSEKDINALYIVAYNLYSEQKYREALDVFNSIAFYNHFDKRGWIGSAACFQLLHYYEDAITCYITASLIDIEDPLPLFHAAECYSALKKYSEAILSLDAVLVLPNNPSVAKFKTWATKMKEALKLIVHS